MTYEVVITDSAKKELAKLPSQIARRLLAKIQALKEDPRPSGYKKLTNFDLPNNPYKALYRVRVGDYRAIYSIEDELVRLIVVKIAHRRAVYE